MRPNNTNYYNYSESIETGPVMILTVIVFFIGNSKRLVDSNGIMNLFYNRTKLTSCLERYNEIFLEFYKIKTSLSLKIYKELIISYPSIDVSTVSMNKCHTFFSSYK